jgi:prophage antirepressor-like protein
MMGGNAVMENVQVFKSDGFCDVRVVVRNEEPWFVTADVCRALDLDNTAMAVSKLDSDERVSVQLIPLAGSKA